jgi:hypothetical protein
VPTSTLFRNDGVCEAESFIKQNVALISSASVGKSVSDSSTVTVVDKPGGVLLSVTVWRVLRRKGVMMTSSRHAVRCGGLVKFTACFMTCGEIWLVYGAQLGLGA